MKKGLTIFLLINLLFLGCLNEVDPEFGLLRLITDWEESVDDQLLREIEQLNVLIEPGNLSYSYDSLKHQIDIDCELGIYNIGIRAIGDTDRVLFSADTSKILIEPFTTKELLLTMIPAFPHLPPKFAALEKRNFSNSGHYRIQWHPANKATQYDLMESNDSLFSDYIMIYTGADTAKEVSKTTQKSYYYKVRAKNDIAGSPWSDWIMMTFETDPLEILTDTLPTGKIEEVYETLIIAEGGIAPYSYRLSAGNLPAGLTMNEETGLITGIPETPGNSMFTIKVSDNGDPQQVAGKEFEISVDPADLMITTTVLADGKVGEEYSQSLTVSGGIVPYTWSLSSGNLPEGLALDNETGEITGMPTTVGTFTVTIQVTDNDEPGQTFSKEFTITINPADLTIITTMLADGKVGDDYSQTLSASGGITPYTWLITNGSLPNGLNLDAETGEISGTPTTAGISSVTIQVADNSEPQQSDSNEFMITVEPDDLMITTTTLADGKVGDVYTQTLSALGGITPYTWSITSGSLPDGLSLNAETGEISGTPTTAGISTVTIQVMDHDDPGQTVSKEFTITIDPPDLVITSITLADGKVGEVYSDTLVASGGTLPFTWSITNGSLPNGLNLDVETGEISGTPTIAGIFTFTTQVADDDEPQQTDSKEFMITVDPDDLTIITTSLADGKVGDAYTQTLSALGGITPYTWSITSSSLPDGLSMTAETGEISGTPTSAGISTFTIQVADNAIPQQSDSKELTITVNPDDLTITINTLADGKVDVEYSEILTASGGTPPYTWSITSGSLPDGLNLDVETGEIAGIPTTAGTSMFTIQIADNSEPEAMDSMEFTLTINPKDLIITTNSLPDGKVNDGYSQFLAATGGTTPYSWTIESGHPPDGITLNGETGGLVGTPTTIGKSNFTVMVKDSGEPEQTYKKRYALTINPGDLIITTAELPKAEIGIEYNQTLSAIGGTIPFIWTVDNGSLPDGLALDSETGIISGMPSTPGSSNFTIRVIDNGDPQQVDSMEFTILVEIADLLITTNELSKGRVNNAYSQPLEASGGITPYHWSVSNGSLPDGLSLNSETGVISGTPTGIGTSTFTIEVMGNNDPPQTDSKEFTIVIDPAILRITTNTLPNGEVGVNYSQIISVTGGISPYSWSVVSGSLPSGLSLNQNTGEISGNPNSDGNTSFTIQVTDSDDPQKNDTKQYTMVIESAALRITTNVLADGNVDNPYSQTLSASGGITPYTWSITSGSLPNGLSLNAETGEITGTPTTAGTSTFTIQVMDNDDPGQTVSKQFSITIDPAGITITTNSLPDGKAGVNYSYQLQASGGITPYTWTELSRNNIPEGITLAADGTLSGSPNNQPSEGTIEVEVTDSDSPGQNDTKSFALTIEVGDLELFSSNLPDGNAFDEYWGTINYLYGTAPLITPYDITGEIPEDITLSYGNQGYQLIFSGTPTEGGTYNFTITVKDSGTPQQTRTDSFTITINP